jgi:aldehyde:ferredoxin oxidoreductase
MGILLTAEDFSALISRATGWDFGVNDFRQAGDRIYNLMRAYCVREGITRASDVLPARLMNEPLTEGPARGMCVEEEMLERLKDAYYEFRGWDVVSGIPSAKKLEELNLSDLIPDMVYG